TASAALRQDASLGNSAFTCVRLPDGRVGSRINGWSRPVRDDVMDTHAHGTIDMHDGLVHSCNAYFAQLAVKIGPEPLLDTAARLGISLTPSSNALRRVRETLPQVGYGQGVVVAAPLKLGRMAAAIAPEIVTAASQAGLVKRNLGTWMFWGKLEGSNRESPVGSIVPRKTSWGQVPGSRSRSSTRLWRRSSTKSSQAVGAGGHFPSIESRYRCWRRRVTRARVSRPFSTASRRCARESSTVFDRPDARRWIWSSMSFT